MTTTPHDLKSNPMTIDTTKQPSIPSPLKSIEFHDTSMDTINKWNPKDLSLHLEPEQESGYIKGHLLRKRLEGKPLLNGTVLDWLLNHPDEIPPDWKGKDVFFWGTIYRNSDDDLYVRCLYFGIDRWHWRYYWLGHSFHSGHPAAVRASALSLAVRVSALESDMDKLKKIIKL